MFVVLYFYARSPSIEGKKLQKLNETQEPARKGHKTKDEQPGYDHRMGASARTLIKG